MDYRLEARRVTQKFITGAEIGGLAGTRTLDQCLKRALLYQLSYQPTAGRKTSCGAWAKSTDKFVTLRKTFSSTGEKIASSLHDDHQVQKSLSLAFVGDQ